MHGQNVLCALACVLEMILGCRFRYLSFLNDDVRLRNFADANPSTGHVSVGETAHTYPALRNWGGRSWAFRFVVESFRKSDSASLQSKIL